MRLSRSNSNCLHTSLHAYARLAPIMTSHSRCFIKISVSMQHRPIFAHGTVRLILPSKSRRGEAMEATTVTSQIIVKHLMLYSSPEQFNNAQKIQEGLLAMVEWLLKQPPLATKPTAASHLIYRRLMTDHQTHGRFSGCASTSYIRSLRAISDVL
jgi:hypothetical protein